MCFSLLKHAVCAKGSDYVMPSLENVCKYGCCRSMTVRANDASINKHLFVFSPALMLGANGMLCKNSFQVLWECVSVRCLRSKWVLKITKNYAVKLRQWESLFLAPSANCINCKDGFNKCGGIFSVIIWDFYMLQVFLIVALVFSGTTSMKPN